MANIGLFFPNRCSNATASGGSWSATLPAQNVCDMALARVARSTDALTASTKIRLDLGSARVLRAFAVVNHNLSAAGQWRVLLGTTAGGSDIYAGTLAAWLVSTVFEAGLAALGMEDGEYLRDGTPAVIVMPTTYTARYVTFEFADATNPNGWIQIGRLFAGGGIMPAINASYGLRESWVDLSTLDASESGADWATARRRLRKCEFVWEALDETEADQLHEMQRVIGTVDDVLYVPDYEQMARSQQYAMLGRLDVMSPLEYPYYRAWKLPLTIRQRA